MRKSYSIPMGMVFGKFYCHKCGNKYKNNPITRTVYPGDSDFPRASKSGNTYYGGSVELTEYNFKCPFCDHEIDYNTQCVYKLIQKKLGRRVLIDEEIKEHKPWANAAQDKRDTITQVCSIVGFGILVLVIALLAQKFGK